MIFQLSSEKKDDSGEAKYINRYLPRNHHKFCVSTEKILNGIGQLERSLTKMMCHTTKSRCNPNIMNVDDKDTGAPTRPGWRTHTESL